MKSSILLCKLVMCALVATLVAQVGFADDRFGKPAMAESSSPDDHLAESSDPDSDLADSEDPDDLVVGSEDLDSRVVGSEDPDAMVVGAESLDQHQGHSTALQDLPNARPEGTTDRETGDDDPQRQRVENLYEENAEASSGAERKPAIGGVKGQIAAIHQAKQALAEAREQSTQADTAYGRMMESGYPRGEARAKIVNDRKRAHKELEAAKQRYGAALDGGVGPASY